jgi:Uncharacterized protein conserved in bacteria (DUF2252)
VPKTKITLVSPPAALRCWGDRIAIASYLGPGGNFDRAIAEFSAAYADQNERGYRAFAAAVNSGRLIAQTGVLSTAAVRARKRKAGRGTPLQPCWPMPGHSTVPRCCGGE